MSHLIHSLHYSGMRQPVGNSGFWNPRQDVRSNSINCIFKSRHNVLTWGNETTQSRRLYQSNKEGSTRSWESGSLGTCQPWKHSERHKDPPGSMVYEMEMSYTYQQGIQTQSLPQCTWWQAGTWPSLLGNLLTCHTMVLHLPVPHTHHHHEMAVTSSQLHPHLSSGWHRNRALHGNPKGPEWLMPCNSRRAFTVRSMPDEYGISICRMDLPNWVSRKAHSTNAYTVAIRPYSSATLMTFCYSCLTVTTLTRSFNSLKTWNMM